MESDADLPVSEHSRRHNRSFDIITSRDHRIDGNTKLNASFDDIILTSNNNRRPIDLNHSDNEEYTPPPEMFTGSGADSHHAQHAPNDDVTRYPDLGHPRNNLGSAPVVVAAGDLDDSLDSVIVTGCGGDVFFNDGGGLKGLENEAYDGDAETDLSYSHPSSPVDPPVFRDPNPFPVLERPVSGRYQKNPNLEKAKASAAPGPYDPHVGVFLAPPLATTETKQPSSFPSPPTVDGRGVRKRLPRPPSRLKMRCAFGWSCLACGIGSFLCAIPALRFYVTANESRKIGDYNSAHSSLRKTAALAALAMALGLAGWTILILYLSDSL